MNNSTVYPTTLRLLVVAVALIGCAAVSRADTIATRKAQIVNDHIVNPYTSTNANSTDPGTEFLGKSAYALAAYYQNTNVSTADAFINALHNTSYLVIPDQEDFRPGGVNYFFEDSMPLLERIAADSTLYNRMSTTAQTNLLDMLFRIINHRSRVQDGGNSSGNVWAVLDSENHNARWRTAFLMGSQVLKNAGAPYGSNKTLADGQTLLAHYNAWYAYWFEYFRQRAREGIHTEVLSPTYEKYTFSCYYNLAQLSEDQVFMGPQAENFLHLCWADLANGFSQGATIPGGSGSRMYQDNHVTQGTVYSLRDWMYVYDWHNTYDGPDTHPVILAAATSSYVPPAIVAACATNAGGSKVTYDYPSRRWGRGTQTTYFGVPYYNINLPSSMRRDVRWTADYVMGSMTYDSTQTFTEVSGQNRFASVVFSTGVNDRLVVIGVSTDSADNYDRDFNSYTGGCYKDVLVAERDLDNTDNNGIRVFIANGNLRNNMVTNGSWIFTYSGNGYAGIRVGNLGYTMTTNIAPGIPTSDGIFLVPTDVWSPVLIQCGQAANYSGGFAEFQANVTGNYFNWDTTSKSMTYVSEAGLTNQIWKQSSTIPIIGGSTRPVNPTVTYNSPYLKATYGQDQVVVSYPGYTDMVLDFNPPSFVTGETLSVTLRNDYTGWVGMKFTVGATAIKVRDVGRWVCVGNTGSHTVKLVVASTGVDVTGGSAVVNTSGALSEQFLYAALTSPVTLAANTSYYIVSQETSGGDQWFQYDTVLSHTTAASVPNAVSATGSSYIAHGAANNCFGPLSFKY
jgi:hypothetical protein